MRHIWSLEIPPDSSRGPIDAQIPFDRFFSDHGDGPSLDNMTQLETWLNEKLIERKRKDRVNLSSQPICLCHGDLTTGHILVGERITILNGEFSGIYPLSFEEFALCYKFWNKGSKFAFDLCKQLFGPKNSANM